MRISPRFRGIPCRWVSDGIFTEMPSERHQLTAHGWLASWPCHFESIPTTATKRTSIRPRRNCWTTSPTLTTDGLDILRSRN